MTSTLPTIKDSGQRQEFDTGSRRDTREGKGRFDLLPTRALRRLARHFEGGSKKYGDRNWEKGQPLSRYLDSALRHAFNFLEGQRDEDHLIAAVWNLLCAADTEERINDGLLDDSLNDVPVLALVPMAVLTGEYAQPPKPSVPCEYLAEHQFIPNGPNLLCKTCGYEKRA